jgi:hypothetical protein
VIKPRSKFEIDLKIAYFMLVIGLKKPKYRGANVSQDYGSDAHPG